MIPSLDRPSQLQNKVSQPLKRRVHWPVPVALFAVIALVLAGCGSKTQPVPEKQYTLTGEVVSVDAKLQTASIRHEPIKGWMDEAMTMDYPIRSKTEFAELHPGDRITATVNVRGMDYDLTAIRKLKPAQ